MILGQGSYGQVTVRNGTAVKKFAKLQHLIQEFAALQYLDDCDYVVHAIDCDFDKLELTMELYDTSLRKWLEDNKNREADILKIFHNILCGLIELHDRNLAHGDIKPGNILVNKNPLKAVLGDCGFVSIAKYSKVERTAAIYRDPIIVHDTSHDMFSFGICFLELIGDIKINRQATYSELKQAISDKISNSKYRKLLFNLLHGDRSRRPSSREVLDILYSEDFPKWQKYNISIIDAMNSNNNLTNLTNASVNKMNIHKNMKVIAYKYKINRGKKGFKAVCAHLQNKSVSEDRYNLYICVTLMILSACFGKSGFREADVLEKTHSASSKQIYTILYELLSNDKFVNIMLEPEYIYIYIFTTVNISYSFTVVSTTTPFLDVYHLFALFQ